MSYESLHNPGDWHVFCPYMLRAAKRYKLWSEQAWSARPYPVFFFLFAVPSCCGLYPRNRYQVASCLPHAEWTTGALLSPFLPFSLEME